MARTLPLFNRQFELGVIMRFLLLPLFFLGSAAFLGLNWSGTPSATDEAQLSEASGAENRTDSDRVASSDVRQSSSVSHDRGEGTFSRSADEETGHGDAMAMATRTDSHSGNQSGAKVHVAAKIPASAQPVPIDRLIQSLKRSLAEIEKHSGYTAVLEQQVQKNGRVLDPETIELKLRRSPFSVYLRWQSDGQEVLFVEGMHDGKLLARPTRGIAALRGIWRLNPTSQHAMKGTRYPLTEVGIEKLNLMALDFYLTNNSVHEGAVCTEVPVIAEGRSAVCYQVSFANEEVSPLYATSHLTFDLETGLLKSVESHSWGPDSRPGMLLERYRYHRIVPHGGLRDHDFSVTNSEYKFQH